MREKTILFCVCANFLAGLSESQLILELALTPTSGGEGATPMSFSEMCTECWADHAEILHRLWGILCTTFGEKFWLGQFRPQSYDVIRGIASNRLFKEIVFSATEFAANDWNGDIMHGFGQLMTTSELGHWILTFQRSSEVTHLGWPHTYLISIVANLAFLGFLEVLSPNTWLIFHIDMFIVPLYTIRCQSEPLTQFALRRFWAWVWPCSLLGHCASQRFCQ